ncbi:type III secretion system cytoplasmic ring protein SctQ [Paraburkholderia strydomiana]|uniref:type III secretion system cytoplasmic ring protein SctQ n=1 Tax=Paraburkholderia strydomiana TaxID=1245417 RepID=UPI002858CBFD|nr:type III secretion system cytoplasmic ring protein SctQ [Paraburkholderia strydomiana]MDR7009583.1 type III secretion protein Q [Paraburkholderia strydomiana]
MLETRPRSLAGLLPAIPPADACAARLLCDARNVDALRRLGRLDAVHVSHVDARDAASAEPLEDAGRIVLAHLSGQLALHVDLARYPSLQILATPAEADHSGTQQSLRNAIANALLAPLVDSFNASGAGTWRVASVQRATKESATFESDNTARLRIALMREGVAYETLFDIALPTLRLIETRLASFGNQQRRCDPDAFATLGIPGRIALGARRVSIRALQKLRPGDVLLRTFSRATVLGLRGHGPLQLRAAWGTPGLRCMLATVALDGALLTLNDDPIMSEETLQVEGDELPRIDYGDAPLDDVPHEAAIATGTEAPTKSETEEEAEAEAAPFTRTSPLDIGELDLPVQFEIDTLALPLSQVAALRRGYVIELDTPVTDARIKLVAHGQTIGHGELVSVGEHLGIRITGMAYASDTDR